MSNEPLCVIAGLTPINIKIKDTVKHYECIKGYGNLIDLEMEAKYWTHPANSVKITEGQEYCKHTIDVYTGGSEGEHKVGSGIATFTDSNMT